jgi:hypothetical protein
VGAATTVRIEVEHEDARGTGTHCGTGGEGEAVEGAEAIARPGLGVVQTRRQRPGHAAVGQSIERCGHGATAGGCDRPEQVAIPAESVGAGEV